MYNFEQLKIIKVLVAKNRKDLVTEQILTDLLAVSSLETHFFLKYFIKNTIVVNFYKLIISLIVFYFIFYLFIVNGQSHLEY